MNINNNTEEVKKIQDRFQALLDSVSEDDSTKYDFSANISDIHYNERSGNLIVENKNEFELTSNANSQIMSRLGIPAQYATKTPANLLKPHFDYWKSQFIKENGNSELFIRAKGSRQDKLHKIRAFLSPNYRILDNTHVLSALKASVDKDTYTVTNYKIEDDMLNIRLIFDKLNQNNIIGPDGKANSFFAGLHITNGETGNFSVNIDLIIFELWCLNGAVRRWGGRSLMARKHFGRDINLITMFQDTVQDIHLKAESTMEEFLNLRHIRVANPFETLESLMSRRKDLFGAEIKKSIVDAYNRRPEETLYGVVSALTQGAQGWPSAKRLGIEVFAGELIEKQKKLEKVVNL